MEASGPKRAKPQWVGTARGPMGTAAVIGSVLVALMQAVRAQTTAAVLDERCGPSREFKLERPLGTIH